MPSMDVTSSPVNMETIREKIDTWVSEVFPDLDILMADGFEEAFLGVAMQFNNPIPIFDYDKCLKILMKDGMSYEDAEEYLEFNVTGAWVGAGTPAYLFKFNPYLVDTNETSRNTND